MGSEQLQKCVCMCVVSWANSQQSVAGLSISIKFSLKVNTSNRAVRLLLFSNFSKIRTVKNERNSTSVEVQLCFGKLGSRMLGEIKHFLSRGWRSDLPVYSLSQDRGGSGSENKWRFSFLPGAGWACQPEKMEGCLGQRVIQAHSQLQLECKYSELLKENVILPWISILRFNFPSPQTSGVCFCHSSPWRKPFCCYSLLSLSPLTCFSRVTLPSASLPASTSSPGKNRRLLKKPL